jgi:hypothetical protein
MALLCAVSVARPAHAQGVAYGTYPGILTETVESFSADGTPLGGSVVSDRTTLTLELDVNAGYPPYTALLTTSDGRLDLYFPMIGYGGNDAFGSMNYASGPFVEDANFVANFLYVTPGYIDTAGGSIVVDSTNVYSPPGGTTTEDFVTFQSATLEPSSLVQAGIGAFVIACAVCVRARRARRSRVLATGGLVGALSADPRVAAAGGIGR